MLHPDAILALTIAAPSAVIVVVGTLLYERRFRESFVSNDGIDLCVICHRNTGVPTATPVDVRLFYVEGSGQCCASCGRSQ